MLRPSLDSLKTRRNFEGRIHPLTHPNWLASPPLVVAYALTGTTRIDLEREATAGRSFCGRSGRRSGEAIPVLCRLDTQIEVAYYPSGGILKDVPRRLREG